MQELLLFANLTSGALPILVDLVFFPLGFLGNGAFQRTRSYFYIVMLTGIVGKTDALHRQMYHNSGLFWHNTSKKTGAVIMPG
jgi:hypothetical protein